MLTYSSILVPVEHTKGCGSIGQVRGTCSVWREMYGTGEVWPLILPKVTLADMTWNRGISSGQQFLP